MPEREWAEGQDVIVVNYAHWSQRARADVIERLTKTQVVTANRGKFNRATGNSVGGTMHSHMYSATDPVGVKALHRTRLAEAADDVTAAAKEFAKAPSISLAQAVRQAVDYWEFTTAPATPTENP